MSSEVPSGEVPSQSPFFRALHGDRYERQRQIRNYESVTGCSLIVFCGPIEPRVITPFADAVGDVDPDDPLDLMLSSLGGDAETALRLALMCHADREQFRVIVPDMAASAATLLALAAESIMMSSTSTLGPVDPQILLNTRGEYYPAKYIVQIVEELYERSEKSPQLFEIHMAMLADIDAVIYQIAKAAMDRTRELIPEFLGISSRSLSVKRIEEIVNNLQGPSLHSAVIGHARATELGLPATYLQANDPVWDAIWRLHTHYTVLQDWSRSNVIEGRRVSFHFSGNDDSH